MILVLHENWYLNNLVFFFILADNQPDMDIGLARFRILILKYKTMFG